MPLLGPAVSAVPRLGLAISTAPLPGPAISAVPLLEPAISAAPLPEGTFEIACLTEEAGTLAPLPGTAAPLVEEWAQTVQLKDPASEIILQSEVNDVVQGGKKAVVEPAQPDDYWIQEDSASRPLPLKIDTPASTEVDLIPTVGTLPADVRATGPAPLAIPETMEISPEGSPQCPSDSESAPAADVPSPIKPSMGRPSVAEILQQRVVSKQVMTTITETKEIVQQQPSETGAEPMIISGGNTPVAPDNEEINAEEEWALMVNETCL